MSSPETNIIPSAADKLEDSEEDVVVEEEQGQELQNKGKRVRRKNRGKPKKGKKEEEENKVDLNDSVQIEPKSSPQKSRFTKPAKVRIKMADFKASTC